MIRGEGVCAPIFEADGVVYCLTVAHVLTGASEIFIDGQQGQLVGADLQQEVAVVSFRRRGVVQMVPTRIDVKPEASRGCLWTLRENQVVRECGPISQDAIQLTVVPGQSGSPVMGEHGYLLGLVYLSNGQFVP